MYSHYFGICFFVRSGFLKTNSTDPSHKSDMTKKIGKLQKREQAEKAKVDGTSPINNYGASFKIRKPP